MYVCCVALVFVFKQKTAYEMRISDGSSDVCSSDLVATFVVARDLRAQLGDAARQLIRLDDHLPRRGPRCHAPQSSARVRCTYARRLLRLATGGRRDRKSGVLGMRVYVRVELGGLRILTKKNNLISPL